MILKSFSTNILFYSPTILSTENLVYDPTFWGNQNFIKPEDNIQQAIKRISNSMQQVAFGKIEDE